jgi:hypothetical protein
LSFAGWSSVEYNAGVLLGGKECGAVWLLVLFVFCGYLLLSVVLGDFGLSEYTFS